MAAAELRFHPSKAAHAMRKVLMSAVANAVDTGRIDAERLTVSRIEVDEGFRMKRVKARAQGRANRIHKRTSHITIVLGEGETWEIKKSNAKPKPRPKWDTKKKAKKDEPKAEAIATEAAEPVAEETMEAAEVAETTEVEVPAEEPAAEEDLSAESSEDAEAEGKQE